MKKLVLGPSHKTKHLKSLPKLPGDKTLNGFDYDKAQVMINNFALDYTNDQGLKSVSAWFSKADIQTMQTVLNSQAGTVDGVRFNFGEFSKNNTQIIVKLLLTVTKPKIAIVPNHLSTHGDYPLRDALLVTELGNCYTNQAAQVFYDGGLLYGKRQPVMSGVCSKPSPHSVNDPDSYAWVQKRHDIDDTADPLKRDKSPYNTKSEWFDICFISSFFEAILTNSNNFDGLRVYLGMGFKDEFRNQRDVFILVPTSKGAFDDYKCITLIPSNLCGSNQNPLHKDTSKGKLIEQFNNKYFKSNGCFMDGGYDKGELCPDKCN